MDFITMQQELSEVIAESTTKTFPTATRKRWINEGVIDVCRRTLCLQKEVTKNVVAGTLSYDIVSDWSLTDFIDFTKEGITHKDSQAAPSTVYTPLKRKSVEWFDENVPGWRMTDSTLRSDTVLYYAHQKGTKLVYFNPVAKTAVTGGWIIRYHHFPITGTTKGGLVATTDEPFDSVPDYEPYHRLPVLFAAYRALLKAGVPKSQQVFQEYAAGIELFKREMRLQPDREPEIAVFNYRAT